MQKKDLPAVLATLYRNRVLGDGRGFASPAVVTASEQPSEVAVQESAVQYRKRIHHDRRQAREIDKQIRQFAALGDCDHD
jgi:hypothetical protein